MAKEELVYVTYTCKRCHCAFIDLDPNNNINDTPRTNRYCPKCEKEGYKNTPLKTKKKQKYDKNSIFFKSEIQTRGITEDRDIKFLKRQFLKIIQTKEMQGKKIVPRYIFNEAMEILSYQEWKQ